MIRIIEQALRSDITGLPFIERYGGVAVLGRGYPAGSKQAWTVPISMNTNLDNCFESNKYKSLIPDKAYKSVSYLEQNLPTETEISTDGRAYSSTRVNLVCWLNLKKLGFSDLDNTTRFELAAMKAIYGSRDVTVDGIQARVNIKRVRIMPKDLNQIFSRYSFGDANYTWAFSWPYTYFSISFDAEVFIGLGCLDEVSLGDEIDCIETF